MVVLLAREVGGLHPVGHGAVEPLAAPGDPVDEALDVIAARLDHPFGDGQHARDEVRPDVLGHEQDAAVAVHLGLGHERLARDDCVDGVRVKRGGHVGRGHLHERHGVDAHAPLLERLVDDQPLVREPVGHGDRAALQVFDPEDRRVLADHHGGPVAVAEVDDLDRHPLFAERHGHGGEDERRLQVVRQERLFELGPAVEADRLEDPVPRHLLIDEVRDGACQVAGDRDEADAERGVAACTSCRRAVEHSQVHRAVEQADHGDPAEGTEDHGASHRHRSPFPPKPVRSSFER